MEFSSGQQIQIDMSRYQRQTAPTRTEMVGMFTEQLNEERKAAGYKPLTPAFVSMKVADAKMTEYQMYEFYKDCASADSFGRCFFGKLKVWK